MSRALGADPVLEAGCGNGWLVAWLRLLGHAVIGLDFRARPAPSPPTGTGGPCPSWAVICSSFRSPTPRSRRVLSLGAIEHIETGPERALAEHRRVLRDGGRLVITLPAPELGEAPERPAPRRAAGSDVPLAQRSLGRAVRGTRAERPRSRRFVQYELSTRLGRPDRGCRIQGEEPSPDRRGRAGLGRAVGSAATPPIGADLLTSSSSAGPPPTVPVASLLERRRPPEPRHPWRVGCGVPHGTRLRSHGLHRGRRGSTVEDGPSKAPAHPATAGPVPSELLLTPPHPASERRPSRRFNASHSHLLLDLDPAPGNRG